jgi:hypothetical protein
LNVTITVSNVPGTFFPQEQAVKRLFELIRERYHCSANLILKTTGGYECDENGKLSPSRPVEVIIVPAIIPGEKKPQLKDFSKDASEICLQVTNLLMSASLGEYYFYYSPVIKIVAWDHQEYLFRNGQLNNIDEWRGR